MALTGEFPLVAVVGRDGVFHVGHELVAHLLDVDGVGFALEVGLSHVLERECYDRVGRRHDSLFPRLELLDVALAVGEVGG